MKSYIDISKTDITTLDMDVIVNPTNRRLREGSGGVCAAIFQKAGAEEMTKACLEIGHKRNGLHGGRQLPLVCDGEIDR